MAQPNRILIITYQEILRSNFKIRTTGINIKLLILPTNLCKICIVKKQTQKSYNHIYRRGIRSLQIVHSDLIGLLFRSIAPYDKKKHVSLSIIIVTLQLHP